MREHNLLELLKGHLRLDGDAGAVDDLRARVAEHMHAEHLVVLLPDDDLAYSFSALILCDKAAGVGHRKLDDRIFLAGSLGLLFG